MFNPGDLIKCIDDRPGPNRKAGRRNFLVKDEVYVVLDCRLCDFSNGWHAPKHFVYINTGHDVHQYPASRFVLVGRDEPEDDLYV